MKQTRVLPVKSRRTQDERSRQTRKLLIEAAIDTLIEAGYAKTTVMAISERAGVSRGAQLHHFATKSDLIVAATRELFAAFVRHVRNLAQAVSAGQLDLDGFVDGCWNEIFKGRWFYASLQLISAARTEPELKRSLQPAIQDLHRALDEIWQGFFRETELSAARVDTLFNLTLCLFRGMAVQAVLREDPAYYKELLGVWKEILPQLVVGQGTALPLDGISAGKKRRTASR